MTPISAFKPGCLGEMTTPAFIMPVDSYCEPLAVFGNGEAMIAVFVGDQHRFEIMSAVDNDRWKGVLFQDLVIEIDLSSAFSTESEPLTKGALLRTSTELKLHGSIAEDGYRRVGTIVIANGLPPGPERYEIGFRRWSLVKRDGDRILFERVIEAEALQTR